MFYTILIIGAVGILYWLLAAPSNPKVSQHDDPVLNGELLRGQRVLSSSHTAEIAAKRSMNDPNGLGMTLAGITLPASADVTSYCFQGGPRSGKSLSFIQALTYAREKCFRAIVVDNGSAFMRRFYKEGDIILNPFDARSESFSLFNHIEEDWDCIRLAKSIMPDSEDASANEWVSYAQAYLSSVLLALHRKGGEFATMKELVRVLTVATVQELQALCAGLPIIPMLGQEKMFGSVQAMLSTKLAVFTYLKSDGEFFSLTNFIRDETGSQFIWLTYRDDQYDMLKALISLQVDILISAALSIKESRSRRIMFALDEVSALGRVQSLVPLLERGAKYGCMTVLGMQSVSQMESAYNKQTASTIFSCLGTWLCLRSPDPHTAEFIAKLLGRSQHKRTVNSHGGSGDSGVGWSEQIAEEYLVMPSELQALDNCEGYLKIVGSFQPSRIRVPYAQDMEDRTPAFLSRDFKAERKAMVVQESTEIAGMLDDMLDPDTDLLDAFDEIQK